MAIRYETPKPEIKIFHKNDKDYEKVIQQITLGIEEEGIPFVVEERGALENPVTMAYRAAESSRLGIGIGVGDEIALHYIKLKQDQPLFEVPYTTDQETLRTLGSNAARLIKGMPFKELG